MQLLRPAEVNLRRRPDTVMVPGSLVVDAEMREWQMPWTGEHHERNANSQAAALNKTFRDGFKVVPVWVERPERK